MIDQIRSFYPHISLNFPFQWWITFKMICNIYLYSLNSARNHRCSSWVVYKNLAISLIQRTMRSSVSWLRQRFGKWQHSDSEWKKVDYCVRWLYIQIIKSMYSFPIIYNFTSNWPGIVDDPELSSSLYVLSLIHISEPTRPY